VLFLNLSKTYFSPPLHLFKTMQHNYSAFLERNTEVPEVKSPLNSVKFLTQSKDIYLKRLSFEAEPVDFPKLLSTCKFNKRQTKEELHGG
jgi:hypothetical protein